ncbi:MAG: MFS transporter [Solibacillus sp.]|uniref:MFS transporter n=1 Tax=unclassified Solibacillus TaxID=2637870 RepID=UPI0030F93194
MNLYHHKTFQKIYAINLLSNVSSVIFTFIVPIILYEYTKSAFAMSMMRMVEFLPNVLLGMLIGVFVDRMNRRLVLQYANTTRVIIAALFVFFLTSQDLSLWTLYVLGFLLSSLGYMIGSATNAILPQLFDKQYMTDIQSKFAMMYTLVSIIGPGLLGAMLLWVSNDMFLWLFLTCHVVTLILVQFIERVPTPVRKQATLIQDLKEGIIELIGNRSLFIQTWTIFFSNFASSLIIGILTFYALDQLQLTKEQLGLMLTIAACGGILGAKVIQPLRKKLRRGQIYTYSTLVEVIILAMMFFTKQWIFLGVLLGLRTAISTMTNIVYLALRQETTPNHLLGRVAGTSSMIMKLALPIGLLIGGIWADTLPIQPIFLISAAIILFNFFLLIKVKFTTVE